MSGALAFALVSCDAAGPGPVYDRDLRTAIKQLKADVAAAPTDESTVAARSAVVADWADALSLAGHEMGLEGPRVRIQSTLPPTGSAAVNAGAAVDRLVREFTLREEAGALGSLEAGSLGPFEARQHATVSQTWTAGSRAVETGGGFWVARHFNANYGAFQTTDPAGAGYVAIETDAANARFETDVYMASGPHGGFRAPEPALMFRVAEGRVEPGESVTITYGDTSGGGPGIMMAQTSSARLPFPLYVDLDGSGEWRPLPILPFAVVGTSVAGVHGFAPSVVRPGETFEMSVRAEDRFYNRATGDIPGFDVSLNGELRASTEPGTEAIAVVELALDEPGVYWTAIRSRGAGPAITGDANPILVAENPEYGIYWGDTHGHSGYAEGIGTLDFFLRFARDDARLDFVTHSEHDIWLDAGEWELMREKSAEYDEPGRFIPYLGWEWTRHTRQGGGHHNVLYRTVEDQDVISVLEFPTLSELYRELDTRYDRRDVVVIPHAHNPGDFRQSHPGLEPLVEMMSMHGTFEWFMQEYLSRGHQVGVVAASDDHLSHPGYSAPNRTSLAQRGGLGAVLAPERSRDAIFDGMKARRTYATTGDRIILEFEVNGIGMGSRAPFSDTREIAGRVIGTAPIGSIALIKNEEELWSEDYSLDTGGGAPTDLMLTFYSEETPVHMGDAPRGWRHWRGQLAVAGATLVRVEGTDFANPTTQHVEQNGNGATFRTNTRGETSSLKLSVTDVRPGAAIVLELEEAAETGSAPPFYRPRAVIPGTRVRLPLSELQGGRLEKLLPIEGYHRDSVTLRRVRPDGPRDLTFSYTDTDSPRQGDYYFVRVCQLNDAMAWSSPVWVGGHPSQ
ncbi:MAG: DUF3604 domain-containing protein [Acidobacteria bacterium]|nr:DUF3604 domain-containing protein [Acidobacteriota bacterium]